MQTLEKLQLYSDELVFANININWIDYCRELQLLLEFKITRHIFQQLHDNSILRAMRMNEHMVYIYGNNKLIEQYCHLFNFF